MQRIYEYISTFATQKFSDQFMKVNFSWSITPKGPNISQITKFYKLFKCLQSICVYHDAFSVHSHMLMKKNVNNDVSKDQFAYNW